MARMHHDLKVWREAMSLVTLVYQVTSAFPELEAQVMIAKRLGYMKNDDRVSGSVESVFAMLAGLIQVTRRAAL